MNKFIYRIYQINSAKIDKYRNGHEYYFGSISKSVSDIITMDCLVCEDRDKFKDIIKDLYGNEIKFAYSKKLKDDDLYCIIIAEECYNAEQYLSEIKFKCDCCGAEVKSYWGKSIQIKDWEIKNHLYGQINKYQTLHFCSVQCKDSFINREKTNIKINDDSDSDFWVSKDMFQSDDIVGYIYKITKKSTGEYYIGQSKYIPMFRWCQHLKTNRFNQKNILDYTFEVLYEVKMGEDILMIEKQFIKDNYNKDLSLNIIHAIKEIESDKEQLMIDFIN